MARRPINNIESTAQGVHNLLDRVIEQMNLKNDSALAKAIGITPPQISKLRHDARTISAGVVLAVHEASGLSVKEIRKILNCKSEGTPVTN